MPTLASRVFSLIRTKIERCLADPDSLPAATVAFGAIVGTDQLAAVKEVLSLSQLSYRDAVLIVLAYKLEDPSLSALLRQEGGRSVAQDVGDLFKAHSIPFVKDAFQNIAKNTRQLARGNVPAFDDLLAWIDAQGLDVLAQCFDFACADVAATSRPVPPLPDLGVARFSFARTMDLIRELLATPSQGAYEQFIVAALLDAYHRYLDDHNLVNTKSLNASDLSAGTAGDVEVVQRQRVLDAYEVTTNQWRTKLRDIDDKAAARDLSRIHIVSSDVRGVEELAHTGTAIDVSVLDLEQFAATLVHFMSKEYRAEASRRLYELLVRLQPDIDRVRRYVDALADSGLVEGRD